MASARGREVMIEFTGLVTRQNDCFIWVWTSIYPMLEIQFLSREELKLCHLHVSMDSEYLLL